jgi:hypothetical protein
MGKQVTKKTAAKKTAAKKAAKPVKTAEKPRKKGISALTFAKNIREALEAQGRYTTEYELAVKAAARAMHIESRASAELDSLKEYSVVKVTKYGKNLDEHPTLKTQRAETAEVRRWLEVLGLTADGIINKSTDALDEFDKEINGEG